MPELVHPLIVIALLGVAVISSEMSMRRQLRRGIAPLEARLAPGWLLHRATGVFQDRGFVVEYGGTAKPILQVAIELRSPHSFRVVRPTFLQVLLGPKHRRPLAAGQLVVARREQDVALGGAALDNPDGRHLVVTLFEHYGADSLTFTSTTAHACFMHHGRRLLKTGQLPRVLATLSESAALLERANPMLVRV